MDASGASTGTGPLHHIGRTGAYADSSVETPGDSLKALPSESLHTEGAGLARATSGLQVQLGLKLASSWDTNTRILVFAESLPSWSFLVDTLGFSDIHVYCQGEMCWFRRILQLRHQSFAWDNVASLLSPDVAVLVLLQGSASFCADICAKLCPCIQIKHFVCAVAADRTQQDSRALDNVRALGVWNVSSRRIRHSQCGGVTNERCRVLWTSSRSLDFESSPVSRSLATLVKSTEFGVRVPPPSAAPSVPHTLDLDACIFTKDLHSRYFRLPSVFSHTGFCRRKLSHPEIAAAIDLPVSCLRVFHIMAEMDASMLVLVCSLPPVKVIQDVADTLFASSARLSSLPATPFDVWSPRFQHADDNYEEIKAREVKAAKADDATTETFLWDEAAVLCPPQVTSPRICTGTISPAHHRIFAHLQESLFLRFCRNIRRNFSIVRFAPSPRYQTNTTTNSHSSQY